MIVTQKASFTQKTNATWKHVENLLLKSRISGAGTLQIAWAGEQKTLPPKLKL